MTGKIHSATFGLRIRYAKRLRGYRVVKRVQDLQNVRAHRRHSTTDERPAYTFVYTRRPARGAALDCNFETALDYNLETTTNRNMLYSKYLQLPSPPLNTSANPHTDSQQFLVGAPSPP